ncbi:MAG: hypothetical protein EPO32_07895 [Anaerolineae bacterium]|nr:MAG: hypothetical protein EPO32_07895 [Anaerolineae bacterium]
MRIQRLLLVLILVLFLFGCATPAETPPADDAAPETPSTAIPAATDAPTETAAPTETPTEIPTATPTLVPTPVGADPNLCKLPGDFNVYLYESDITLGFPVKPIRLVSTGTVRVAVLFVDFEDAAATVSPEDVFNMISPGAEEFFLATSYGQMQMELVPLLEWLRMPGSKDDYFMHSSVSHRDYIRQAAALADPDFDFSDIDDIVVMNDPATSPFSYGPAFAADLSEGGIEVDGMTINNGATSGTDLTYWGSTWLNHEMGHNMGLVDLYLYGSSNALRWVGEWSVMGLIDGKGHEHFAWERWQLNWVIDAQVACFPEGGTTTLTAVEVPGGVKLIVVPVGGTRAVVIESRRALGYDSAIPEGGVLVYTVDTSIASGQGGLQVQTSGVSADYLDAPLAAGESLRISGVTITVLESGETTDTVQVEFGP